MRPKVVNGKEKRLAALRENQTEASRLGAIAGRKAWADPEHRAARLAKIMATKRKTGPARYWAQVDKRGPDECWPWKASAARTKGRYGSLSFEGEIRLAHKVSFFLTNGYWAQYLRHTCDFGLCCNPGHLIEGTHADNMQDKVVRGRQARGETSGVAKLTEMDVRAIRSDPRKHAAIASEYGVDDSVICRIRQRKTWRHVP